MKKNIKNIKEFEKKVFSQKKVSTKNYNSEYFNSKYAIALANGTVAIDIALKALQIGRVSRLLKEISVDCILNQEQLNFTSENMQQKVIHFTNGGPWHETWDGDYKENWLKVYNEL